MSQYKLRKTKDLLVIRGLHSLIFPSDEFPTIDNLHAWVVYDSDEDPVGFCTVNLGSSNIAFMSRAGLMNKATGKGLHKRMVRIREKYAKSKGYDIFISYVKHDNIISAINLEKCGYRLYLPEWRYGGDTVLYFMKQIKSNKEA